jgi:hypothetical protein
MLLFGWCTADLYGKEVVRAIINVKWESFARAFLLMQVRMVLRRGSDTCDTNDSLEAHCAAMQSCGLTAARQQC